MNQQRQYLAGASGWYAAIALHLLMLCAFFSETPVRAQSLGILEAAPFTGTNGRQVFEHICQGCHMPNAVGAVGAGRFPALADNPTLASRDYVALTVLMGRRNMPAFSAKHAIGFAGPPVVLSETQMAAVINYVRTHFGNHYKDSISAAEVAALDQGYH